ncbi:Ig-like domain-containing protein [Pseudomonas sp. GM78]|uniref:Ig-like domain-containing protein n=1 Tax=Pseudomonas sp. GM78 TaxID=1144337 RepID=UPI000517BCD8|nr:Ig-like domain-containing protein [Pseudomonas sp. GM78]
MTPTNFIILTQRAPGAEQPNALNVADGAVVVMIKLRGNAMGGDIPSKDHFPYLIADDMENGVKKYSATMVLAKEFIERSDDDKLELIRSVLFPGQKNVFVEHSRHIPHDLVIFGSLDPSKTSLTIEPAVYSLKAGGQPLSYKALLNNLPVDGVSWSVKSLNTNTSSGMIDSVSGVYQPVSAELIGKQSVRNIVTAAYTDTSGQKHRVSALLLVTTEAMTLSPGYVPRSVGGAPVTFVATALSSSTLTWSVPAHGTLSVNGNTAIYTPPADPQSLPEHFVVQPIEVKDGAGETVQACVLLTKFAASTTIEPPFVSALAPSATVDLKVTETLPPEFERRWDVLGGGTVKDGTFTAPGKSSSLYSVVKCDIYWNELLVRTGYSIIQLANFTPEPRFEEIKSFILVALRQNKLYGNGYQQLPLEARIETLGAKLTPEQAASLRLYYVDSDQVVPDVPSLQDGIPYDPDMPVLWSQTRIESRFRPPAGRLDDAPADIPKTNIPLFVVSRSTQVKRFYAGFFDEELDKFYRSDIHTGHPDGIITLEPQNSPIIDLKDYTFERRRISDEGTGSEENDDDFDLYLTTIDYWDLTYKREGSVSLNFAALEFPGVPGLPGAPRKDPFISTVRWESTFHNEQLITFTGYAFNNPKAPHDHELMKFDSIIKNNKALKDHFDPMLAEELAEGRFLIGVFRRTDVRQATHPDDPSKVGNADLYPLKKEVNLILTDIEGHRHPLTVEFTTNRNRPALKILRE